MSDYKRPSAESLEAHIASGGVVMVATYTKATIYKYSGSFRERNGNLEVRCGKRWNQLSSGQTLLCAVRTGRYE